VEIDLIGVTLREKRKEKKIPLKKISQATRIREKYLEALEEEDYGVFPAEVYLKGFLRTYANYLGLDGNELVHIYEQEHPAQDIKPELSVQTTDATLHLMSRKKSRKFKLLWVGVLAIILIILIPGKIFRYSMLPIEWYTVEHLKHNQNQNKPVELLLEARFKQLTWMRIVADGVFMEERNFSPGELKTWKAKDRFELKIGNVYGLDLRLNNKFIDIISPSKNSVLDLKLDKGAVGDATQ
jgi:cytoskeletal protein RodZ